MLTRLLLVRFIQSLLKNVTNTVDVDFVTTIGSVATATFNAVGESITVQNTGTDGYAVIGHGTGVANRSGYRTIDLVIITFLVWGLVW